MWAALSGLPLVGGLPEQHCPYFGYWSYLDRPGRVEGLAPRSLAGQRGERLGLASVVRVTDDARGPHLARENCER